MSKTSKNAEVNLFGSSKSPTLLNLNKYLDTTGFSPAQSNECNKKNKKSKHKSINVVTNPNGLLYNFNTSPMFIPNTNQIISHTPNNTPNNDTINNDTKDNNDTPNNDTPNNDTTDNDTPNNDTPNNDTPNNDTKNNDTKNNDTKDNDTKDNNDNTQQKQPVEFSKLFDLMELLTNLKLLSHIKQNEKLSCDNGNNFIEIDNRYYLQGIRRWMNGDSREETIKFVDKLINSTESISEKLINGSNEDDSHNLKLLTEDLISCKNGLNNLKLTYNDDKLFISKMDNYIEMIKMRIDKNNKVN
jgi:hypothetical protein